jgi:hypothetical protein
MVAFGRVSDLRLSQGVAAARPVMSRMEVSMMGGVYHES